ncbi:DUF4288 domain-containing protein [Psychrobacillus vulpis]|uniref:DUF4288 domain-containing protein n=1 Tax=Psychrobacillus vulpis TaxID=2325572 RepID=A0A544TVN4_9BACI|nr:DUF4288 domain-containing protein [Psychrobacillus vulpis]TQR21510.1 DUF4288 domain-containing protein [Psychrobacillus vulpis]
MENIYSVKLLFEHISSPESMPNKTFEETINIVRAAKIEDVDGLVKEHFKDVTYTNAFGEITTIKLVMILDIFELVDSLEKSLEFVEVYSHHIILDDEVFIEKGY